MTRPWTEAHRREALRRTYEIAAEMAGGGLWSTAACLTSGALWSLVGREQGFRFVMSEAAIDRVRIAREVKRVRAMAEGRLVRETKTITDRLEAFRCDGCRDSVAEGAPRWSRTSDGNEYCKGCRLDASEHAAENGATVVRVKVRVRHVTRIRRA